VSATRETLARRPAHSVTVRSAAGEDAAGVAAAVAELLVELGAPGGGAGAAAELASIERTARELIASPELGAVIVAHHEQALVGVLAASWQTAIHARGRYGLIQDLWVDRAWRSRGVGAALVEALFDHARAAGVQCIEVGLPRASFAGLAATEAFYVRNGFTPLGPRLRAVLT